MPDDDSASAPPGVGLRVLRLHQVFGEHGVTGLSRSEGYRLMSAGLFPRGFLIARSARGWLQSDVDRWIESRAREHACTTPAMATPVPTTPPPRRPRGRPRKHPAPSIFGG